MMSLPINPWQCPRAPACRSRAALRDQLVIDLLAELAVRALERGQLGDFAVDQAVADADAVLLAPFLHCGAIDQAAQNFLERILARDEILHRQGRSALAFAVKGGTNRLVEFARGNAGMTDGCNVVAAEKVAGAKATHVSPRQKSQDDQDEEDEAEDRTEAGLDNGTKETEHDSRSLGRDKPRCLRAGSAFAKPRFAQGATENSVGSTNGCFAIRVPIW
jgi:hypothetical protein